MGRVNELIQQVQLPRMIRVRQKFDGAALSSVEETICRELDRSEIRGTIRAGMRVAITAGSRGIRHYPEIIRTVVSRVRAWGAIPFVIPAMGSHGGATAAGQVALLRELGITEDSVGAPILSSMDVVPLGKTERGAPVWFAKDAYDADATILIGRIKPHTAFHGTVESGVIKMGVIGCGKQRGAEGFHSFGMEQMAANIVDMGRIMVAGSNVAFGLAILENAYDETFHVEAILWKDILRREAELLPLAKARFAKILFPEYDVLVVDQIGKDISGDGADPNITGRFYAPGIEHSPKVQRLVYLDLTEKSHGNASGVGVADFITRKLFDKIDLGNTYMNTVTNCVVQPAKIPLIMDTAELAIKAGVRTLLHADKQNPRIVRIRDTLHLDEIQISEALLPQARDNPDMEVLSDPLPMVFDEAGGIIS